jgi:acyl carrier protein
MQEIQTKVVSIVRENGFTLYEVMPTARLKDDLTMDSMDILELTMALESEFEIDIEDDVFDQWQTLQDVIQTVASQVEKKAA